MGVQDLVTLDELRGMVRASVSNAQLDGRLQSVITRGSAIVARWCHRTFMFPIGGAAYVEYHDIQDSRATIYTRHRPIIEVTEVTESTVGAHDSAAPLVAGATVTISPEGQIRRISGRLPSPWEIGVGTVRVTYRAGYLDSESKGNVPPELKEAVLMVCANMWAVEEKQLHGVKGVSDSLGNRTFYDTRLLTDEVKSILTPFRWVGEKTWVEDAA